MAPLAQSFWYVNFPVILAPARQIWSKRGLRGEISLSLQYGIHGFDLDGNRNSQVKYWSYSAEDSKTVFTVVLSKGKMKSTVYTKWHPWFWCKHIPKFINEKFFKLSENSSRGILSTFLLVEQMLKYRMKEREGKKFYYLSAQYCI